MTLSPLGNRRPPGKNRGSKSLRSNGKQVPDMDKGPRYIQRAIIELIETSGPEDVGWTTSWLCEHVYSGTSSRSQRTALIRAIKTMKLPVGWKFERGWDELQLINDERFHARNAKPRRER
jgi:hypothetical protein